MSANGFFFHRTCFRCSHCNCQLKIGGYSLSKGVGGDKGKFFCSAHYRQLFLSNPEAINYSRAGPVGGGRRGAAGGGGVSKEEEKMEVDPPLPSTGKGSKVRTSLSTTDEELPVSSDESGVGKGSPKKKKASLR